MIQNCMNTFSQALRPLVCIHINNKAKPKKQNKKAMHAFICYMGKTKTQITEIIDPLKHKQDQGQIVSKEQNITELENFI